MSGFDTSGYVPEHGNEAMVTLWSDLNPFTQGYVEALFVTFRQGDIGHWPDTPHAQRVMRFDRLAPETLARIMEDCERFQATDAWRAMLVRGFMSPEAMPRDAGRALWNTRNGGAVEPNFWDDYWTDYSGGTDLAESVATFPPLTPYLGDDGKVYLRDASPSSDRGGS